VSHSTRAARIEARRLAKIVSVPVLSGAGKAKRRERIKMSRLLREGKYLQWWFQQGGRSPAPLTYWQWCHPFMLAGAP
jgi:hypothetical protein